jgi:hypothetical protein
MYPVENMALAVKSPCKEVKLFPSPPFRPTEGIEV